VVVDPHPKSRHKRFSEAVLTRLQNLTQGTPAEVLQQAILALGAANYQDIVARSSLEANTARSALEELVAQDQALILEGGTVSSKNLQSALITSKGYWQQLTTRVMQDVSDYHRINPLRRGIPKEELKSRMKLRARLFSAVLSDLEAKGEILESGPWVQLPGHQIKFTEMQRCQVDGLLAKFQVSPYAPPTIKECQAEVSEEVYNALVDLGELYAIPPEVVFRQQDFDQMVRDLRQLLALKPTVTAAEVRDHFKTSRRYVLAFLEHLDALGITVRQGDARRLRR
jgi:selenocysteine-specific elongation factor